MIQDQPSPAAGRGRHVWVAYAAAIAAGGVGGYLLWHTLPREALSSDAVWYCDGFFAVFLGHRVGESIAVGIAWFMPRLREAEGPGMLGTLCGTAMMVVVWRSLPVPWGVVIATVAQVALGAFCGAFLVYLWENPGS